MLNDGVGEKVSYKKDKRQRLQIRLNDEDKKKLKTISSTHGKSMSGMLGYLVRIEYDRLKDLGFIEE